MTRGAETEGPDSAAIEVAARLTRAIVRNVENVIVGKREQVLLGVLCLMARGHALIEDVPGVGKTTLAKALAVKNRLAGRLAQARTNIETYNSVLAGQRDEEGRATVDVRAE